MEESRSTSILEEMRKAVVDYMSSQNLQLSNIEMRPDNIFTYMQSCEPCPAGCSQGCKPGSCISGCFDGCKTGSK